MKTWIYVEGESDVRGLEALWRDWCNQLRVKGWGVRIIPVDGKDAFLRKIGDLAAQRLAADASDLVVVLPDLYPMKKYDGTRYAHSNVIDLERILRDDVKASLTERQRVPTKQLNAHLDRLCVSAFRHDLEMLLLAAVEQLRAALRTNDSLLKWRRPVEEQNDTKPPKYVVDGLFRTYLKREYRPTRDAPDILGRVPDMRMIVFDSSNGSVQCPVFRAVLDWIGERTGVPSY